MAAVLRCPARRDPRRPHGPSRCRTVAVLSSWADLLVEEACSPCRRRKPRHASASTRGGSSTTSAATSRRRRGSASQRRRRVFNRGRAVPHRASPAHRPEPAPVDLPHHRSPEAAVRPDPLARRVHTATSGQRHPVCVPCGRTYPRRWDGCRTRSGSWVRERDGDGRGRWDASGCRHLPWFQPPAPAGLDLRRYRLVDRLGRQPAPVTLRYRVEVLPCCCQQHVEPLPTCCHMLPLLVVGAVGPAGEAHYDRQRIRWDLSPDPYTGNRRQGSQRGFATRKAADAALAEKVDQVNAGTYVAPSRQRLAVYLTTWLSGLRVKPTTLDSYRLPRVCSRRLRSRRPGPSSGDETRRSESRDRFVSKDAGTPTQGPRFRWRLFAVLRGARTL